MSLVGTLAKLAVGYAVARGVKSVIGGGGASKTGGGSIFGGTESASTQGSTGLEGIMDGLLKGGNAQSSGGAQQGGGLGGLGDILGQLAGGAQSSGGAGSLGGLGGLLTEALGQGNGGLGGLANQPSQQEEAAAGLMIRAMLQAAKSDGRIDSQEKEQLMQHLGDLDQDEVNFINAEMARGIDVRGLASEVPNGMEKQVYMMSLMAIDLDNRNEAQYLNDLAQSMNLGQSDVNQIHAMLNVDPLYG